jgi:hypothetical protein
MFEKDYPYIMGITENIGRSFMIAWLTIGRSFHDRMVNKYREETELGRGVYDKMPDVGLEIRSPARSAGTH